MWLKAGLALVANRILSVGTHSEPHVGAGVTNGCSRRSGRVTCLELGVRLLPGPRKLKLLECVCDVMRSQDGLAITSNRGDARPVIGAILPPDSPQLLRLTETLDASGLPLAAQATTGHGLNALRPDFSAVLLVGSDQRTAILEEVRTARTALPSAAVIVTICAEVQARDARSMLRVGADGVVTQAHLETALVPAIRAAMAGLVCLPRSQRAHTEPERLSIREKQILAMLVRGFTNAEIARKLYLAESTVKSHLSSAYTKLGVRSRKDAADLILDPGEGLGPGILAMSGA
jgi:DNA-binding NarL/FixJ family response regulator